MPLREGDRFDRFIVGTLLGLGGMGEVYRAYDTVLQRAVALKVLRAHPEWGEGLPASPEAVARLTREARAAAAIDHPNAIAIFDVGEAEGAPFLAMELIDGRSLRALMTDDAQPLDRRVRWMLDVARALAAAHRKNVIHRDVKPENVMVRSDGVVKVLDFGIARRAQNAIAGATLTGGPQLPTLTEKGMSVGTPLYMAPEHLRGEPLDGRSDQFAWGVVAYELFTGVSPWASDEGPLQTVSNILDREPTPLRERVPALDARVERVVLRALAKDAAARFETMDALVDALEPLAGMASAPAPSARHRARPLARLGPRLLFAAATIVATVAALCSARAPHREAPEAPARIAAPHDGGPHLSTDPQAAAALLAERQAAQDASLDAGGAILPTTKR